MTTTGTTRTPAPKWITAFVIFGVLLIASLPVALIFGGLAQRKIVEPVAGGLTTTGTIDGVTKTEELHGNSYTPTIMFFANDGHVYSFDGPSDTSAQTVGMKVTVSYDPDNPDHAADLSAGTTSWKILVLIGAVLGVAELGLIVWIIKRRRGMRRAAVPT